MTAAAKFKDATGAEFDFPLFNSDPATGAGLADIKAGIAAVLAAIQGEATTDQAALTALQALQAAQALLETHADAVSENAILAAIRDAAQAADTHTDAAAQIAAVQALATTVATHADVVAEGSTEAAVLAALQGALTFTLPTGAATDAKLEAVRALLAGTLTTRGTGLGPPRAITPGTPVTAGRGVRIVATAAGVVALKFADGSVLPFPVNVGVSADELAVVDVVAAQTTAAATVYVLS